MKKNCLVILLVVFAQFLSFSQQIKRAPACGTVGFDWKTPGSIPSGDIFTGCPNTNYQLKADLKATANEYIAPGFGIVLGSGTMNISKVEISEGGGAYQNIGTIVNLPYSSPNYDYNIKINGTVVTGPVTINIVDHATGAVVASAPYSANVVIPIPKGTLKGTATFSGPGVSNYQLDYPSAGKVDYTANGYAIFNPSVAGNGTHTITYTWNNGTSACGSATKIVEVKGCSTPAVPCGTCAAPTCPIGNVAQYANRQPPTGAQTCNSGLSATGVYTTYQTVYADANGKLGAYCQNTNISAATGVTTSVKITSKLYKDGDCGGAVIPTANFNTLVGTTDNVFNRSSTNGSWNPEWNSLTSNGKYILQTIFTLGAGSTLTKYCMDYYGSTSCAAKIGTTAVTINGAAPLVGKNPSANYYLLCKNDKIEINTTGYTLPPVGGGGTAGIGYMPFVCPPTAGKDPHADACWGQNDLYDINNPSSDINDGSLVAQFPSGLNHTYYIVPITMDEAIANSMNYDQNSDGCFQTGTPIKITYLNDIAITKNEVCASSKVTFTISGGTPEYKAETGGKYTISTNKGTLSATTLTTSGGTVDLTGLATNDNYTITVDDGTGCTKTFTGTYSCACTPPTITPTVTNVCAGATSTTFSYTSTGTPTTYSITWNAAAITAGFINVVDATLAISPQTITLPLNVTAATYTGSLIVKNASGCLSNTQNISVTVHDNPVLTATPSSILAGATSNITLTGGSGTPAISTPWTSSAATTIATLTNSGQTATVTGVAQGNTDVTYTDDKGCSGKVTVAITVPGCNTITNGTAPQSICLSGDPAAMTVSTSETAAKGISFVAYSSLAKPADANAIYSGVGITGLKLSDVDPTGGTATFDIPAFGTTGSTTFPLPGDYFIYAILTNPTVIGCRPYIEMKITITDSTKVNGLTASTVTGNTTTFTWGANSAVNQWGIETALTANASTAPAWVAAPNLPNTGAGSFNVPNIPLGQTAHIRITPKDIAGNPVACSKSATASITNPNCTKPIPIPLTLSVPSVCEGGAISVIGDIDASSVLANFKWRVSLNGTNWLDATGPDYDLSVAKTLTIPVTKIGMNNALVKLIVTDQATGVCKDSTATIPLIINEFPNAKISINPDPAILCVDQNQLITVTMIGSKGRGPYVFDYTLDGTAKTDSSLVSDGTGVLTYDFNTSKEIIDSTFILTKVTDKNGCFKAITTNNSVKMQVITAPKPVFTADRTVGCFPFDVIFTDKSTPLNTSVEWDFGDGSPVSKEQGITKYTFKKAGDYTISFKSILNGCWDTMQKTNYIHVKDRPIAQFSPKKTNVSMIDPVITFDNASSNNAVYFKWIFGDGTQVSSERNPTHTFIGTGENNLPAPGNYVVQLYAFVNNDCWDSISRSITIDDEQIFYIPNTFTPDGNEFNNVFQPVFTSGYDAQNFHFEIYNRWGELIFETYNPAIGWDGTYGDKLLMSGSYTWKLQFREKMTEKEHYLTGTVNLLK